MTPACPVRGTPGTTRRGKPPQGTIRRTISEPANNAIVCVANLLGGDSANLLTWDAAQKLVDDFARKSFPGYRVEKVGKESYRGRPLYTASLTGNESRFEVRVDAVDGKVLGVYPIEE